MLSSLCAYRCQHQHGPLSLGILCTLFLPSSPARQPLPSIFLLYSLWSFTPPSPPFLMQAFCLVVSLSPLHLLYSCPSVASRSSLPHSPSISRLPPFSISRPLCFHSIPSPALSLIPSPTPFPLASSSASGCGVYYEESWGLGSLCAVDAPVCDPPAWHTGCAQARPSPSNSPLLLPVPGGSRFAPSTVN